MSTQTAPQRQSSDQALRSANQRFYAAFESRDIEAMSQVWAHDDNVQCVHPGWDLLIGWDEVRERWARIFANARRVRIALSSVWVRLEGDVGWVACTEHVTTAFADGFDEATVQATNIFLFREGQWRLVAHHASPLPTTGPSTVQ
ncbi:MAG TPA: nuclear transport factor 2 family protein [Candidatus Limnocylindrales bacterium]|nr:nuclear transport factor 2 family protein [Candidatus Limnocylindrales bacterium]